MTEHRFFASWLRPVLGMFALAGVLALSACGGGSGAPNNPYAAGPGTPAALAILPATFTAYAGTPATLTISGGLQPYSAFSSNTSVLPLSLASSSSTIVLVPTPVALATDVTVTVRDFAGTIASATVTVTPAPLLNGLTVTPNSAACGANAVCSGQTATASVTVTGPAGGGIANRQVKFDVVSGDFAIQTFGNPASPLVSTLTVVSDANGLAQVLIKAGVNAFTQPGLLRSTELTTGNQVTGQFTIVQTTNGAAVLSVIPETATISSASTTSCTAGFRVDYFIYGGTPPYRVTNTFPTGATLVNSVVATSGGSFEAVTNGTCVNPLVFSIFDAVGLQTTANLINQPGTGVPPVPTPLVVAPTAYGSSGTPVANCNLASGFDFVISGGTPSYGVVVTGATGTATPPTVPASGGTTKVTFTAATPGAHLVSFTDQGTPPLTSTATIFCP
jgi:hypothetical protein